eukprot:230278-Chlamydomonas_euryale.AAC.7
MTCGLSGGWRAVRNSGSRAKLTASPHRIFSILQARITNIMVELFELLLRERGCRGCTAPTVTTRTPAHTSTSMRPPLTPHRSGRRAAQPARALAARDDNAAIARRCNSDIALRKAGERAQGRRQGRAVADVGGLLDTGVRCVRTSTR